MKDLQDSLSKISDRTRNTDDYRIMRRSQCENCSTNLFERQQRCELRGRRRTCLCPPCDLYVKLKKMYRPSKLRFEAPKEGSEEASDDLFYEHTSYFDINDYLNDRLSSEHPPPPGHILTGFYYVADPTSLDVANPNEKKIPVFTEPHENCFFVSTTQQIRWERSMLDFGTHEKERIVDGFLRFGKNFAKIAKFANLRSEETVRQFYEVHGDDYRLDFLIAQYNRSAEVRRNVLGDRNESDDEGDDFEMRRRMLKAHVRKRSMKTRGSSAGGFVRRTTRRRTVREMS
uniref:SANT domain-containing protein n=1 Tax=Steinernema glaseri TaxID=37863 RepID=A0A1I7YPX6_9BILA